MFEQPFLYPNTSTNTFYIKCILVLPVNIWCQVSIFPPNAYSHKKIAKLSPTMPQKTPPNPDIITLHLILVALNARGNCQTMMWQKRTPCVSECVIVWDKQVSILWKLSAHMLVSNLLFYRDILLLPSSTYPWIVHITLDIKL